MKNLIQTLFAKFGFELRKKNNQRNSMEGSLEHLRKQSFQPRTIIDIGAAFGDWTLTAKSFFPEARYILAEPLAEYVSGLQKIPKIEFHTCAVSDADGEIVMHVHKDLVGSSIFDEQEAKDTLVAEDRKIKTVSLNTLALDAKGPLLIKIDAQGAELLILRNSSVFEKTEVIILECSLFHSIKDAPLMDTVCAFMRDKGFAVYDILDLSYRLLDNSLSQINIVFIKETSSLRKNHAYATEEQRIKQNERMMRRNQSRLV